MSLDRLAVEVLLIIEWYARDSYEYVGLAPSLQLSWVCQQLRAVFMPRFWSFVRMEDARGVERCLALLESSPPDTYRCMVKYLLFVGSSGASGYMDGRLYLSEPTPNANDELEIEPDRYRRKACGPRVDETWPFPDQLVFNDPRRYFKLAGRKRDPDAEDESDETGSSAASEAEEEERKCTLCHPTMHKLYRHRVNKPDDYWLPGAVHSVGPLKFNRRTWGRYPGPDGGRGSSSLSTMDEFVTALVSVVSRLDIEAFEWAGGVPIPRLLCEELVRHPTFYKLGVSARGLAEDYFHFPSVQYDLALLAPSISVLQEERGTLFGQHALPFELDDDEGPIYRPLTDYPEDNSMRGFMDFLLAAKKLKHLSAECLGVFITPELLGVFAKLHSLRWTEETWQPDEHVIALSKLRSSLWKLAQAVGRPNHLLEAVDVQLLADSSGEHAELAAELAPLSGWLEQEELAGLVAQGWNEQEERGPNESAVFYPPYFADSMSIFERVNLSSAYDNPVSTSRW